jgi:hypothetical protein
MARRLVLAVLLVAIAVPASVVVAGKRANQRFLARILAVDGPGSGIDADTVHGLTPDQMRAEMSDDVSRRLTALEARFSISRQALYAHSRRATLATGESQHLYADCDDPRDVALSCAGGAISGATESPITWMGVVLGDGTASVDRCLVVVQAGSSAAQTEIEATVRCLQLRS